MRSVGLIRDTGDLAAIESLCGVWWLFVPRTISELCLCSSGGVLVVPYWYIFRCSNHSLTNS